MTETELTNMGGMARTRVMKSMIAVLLVGAGSATSGCVNVTAPDKPIEINLNVNVTQEVVYRLDNEAKTLIQDNPGIF